MLFRHRRTEGVQVDFIIHRVQGELIFV
jgi:hypothetical protein